MIFTNNTQTYSQSEKEACKLLLQKSSLGVLINMNDPQKNIPFGSSLKHLHHHFVYLSFLSKNFHN